MSTAPVSGSKKVRIVGGKNINIIIVNSFTSSFIVIFLGNLIVHLLVTLLRVMISTIFINSLGCSDPIPGIINQHLLPLIGCPITNNNANNNIFKIYK